MEASTPFAEFFALNAEAQGILRTQLAGAVEARRRAAQIVHGGPLAVARRRCAKLSTQLERVVLAVDEATAVRNAWLATRTFFRGCWAEFAAKNPEPARRLGAAAGILRDVLRKVRA